MQKKSPKTFINGNLFNYECTVDFLNKIKDLPKISNTEEIKEQLYQIYKELYNDSKS